MDDLLYGVYVNTFAAFEAAISAGDATRLNSLLGDVIERHGVEGLVALIAFTDASASRIRRSKSHLRRRIGEICAPCRQDPDADVERQEN